MYAVKQCAILTLLLAASSDATSLSNFSKFADPGVGGAKDELRKLGLTSLLSVDDNQDTVLTTWDDLRTAKVTEDMIKDAYQRGFGVRPDKIHLNDDICRKNGWFSYNRIGKIRIFNVKEEPKSSFLNHRIVTNDLDSSSSEEVDMTTSVSDTTTTTVTRQSGISTTASISVDAEAMGLGIEAGISTTFSLSNTVGSTQTQHREMSVGSKIQVPIPPHSKINVTLEVTWISKTADWEIPVYIDPMGRTGVDFHRRVKGHYYWSLVHAAVATPPFQGIIRGRLDSSYRTEGNIHLQKM